jgi:FdhD protein
MIFDSFNEPHEMGAPPFLPLITRATRALTAVISTVNEDGESLLIAIAGEHPLTIYLDRREVVTLMTLGARPEALTLGYLRNQRLVKSFSEIASVRVDWDANSVAVTTRGGSDGAESMLRRPAAATACAQGSMFADWKRGFEAIRLPVDARLSQKQLLSLVEQVRQKQEVYKLAGAVHGCALARPQGDGVELLMFVEDVGRHNAVDTIAGQMWLDGLEGADKIVFTTARMTSEMVIKIAQVGVPFLVSRSGTTQMGWEVARQTGLTAIGRAKGRHYLIYAGSERVHR